MNQQPMTNDEFENYLTLLSRMLQLRSGQNEAIAEELRVHLEERFGELTAQGVEPKKAVSIALSEFGDAAALASKFAEISRLKTRRIMMRSTIGCLFVGAVVLGWVLSAIPDAGSDLLLNVAQAQNQTEEKVDQPVQLSEREIAEEATRQKLEKKISFCFVDEPISYCMAFLADQTETQVLIDAKSLEDFGMDPESPITMQMKEVPTKLALRLMLEQIDLAYRIDHNLVIVTTQEDAEGQLCIRMYDIVGLLESNIAARPKISTTQFGGSGFGDGGGFGDNKDTTVAKADGQSQQKTTPRRPLNNRSRKTPNDRLCELIHQMVSPESWDSVGGPGSLAIYNGVLVVCQTEEVHREVESLLDQLRTKINQRRQAMQVTEAF